MNPRSARGIATLIGNVLIVLAIAATARLVVQFFGQIAAQGWGDAVIALTTGVIIPFGVDAIKTPYGGVFDVNAAIMVVLFLLSEGLLSRIRVTD